MTCGDIFQAIADPTRRNLLDRLREGEQAVTQLAAPFDMSMPAISQHLQILCEAGLVGTKTGRTTTALQAECRAA